MAFHVSLPYLASFEPLWDDAEARIGKVLPPTLVRRVRHVVTETRRVKEAEDAARRSDWETFGALMNASGESSAHDYEISHPVVEALVHALRELPGVLGARMMGGGEGGPALVLLRRDMVQNVSATLRDGYYTAHPVTSEEPFQVCTFGPGAHRET